MYPASIGNVHNLLSSNATNPGFAPEKKITFDKILYVSTEAFYLLIIWSMLWYLVIVILPVECLLNGDVIIVLSHICRCSSDKTDASQLFPHSYGSVKIVGNGKFYQKYQFWKIIRERLLHKLQDYNKWTRNLRKPVCYFQILSLFTLNHLEGNLIYMQKISWNKEWKGEFWQ